LDEFEAGWQGLCDASWQRCKPYISNAFHVLGLWKHVQWNYFRYFKDIPCAQNVQVSRQRGRVAGNVENLPRTRFTQYFQHFRRTTSARRVKNNRARTRFKPP
jgi:hypothetical protein